MPLQDHFHPPLSARRLGTAFLGSWATYLSADLNRRLPEGFFAQAYVPSAREMDVATFSVQVQVFSDSEGPTLVGAIELVSPSNKDRPSERDAFVSKCASYLQQGVGLGIVDVVTNRRANLHTALLARVAAPDPALLHADLYAAAYHPVRQEGRTTVEVWQEELAVGRPLPTIPLWLRGGMSLPVELEATYERTCQEQRVRANGA